MKQLNFLFILLMAVFTATTANAQSAQPVVQGTAELHLNPSEWDWGISIFGNPEVYIDDSLINDNYVTFPNLDTLFGTDWGLAAVTFLFTKETPGASDTTYATMDVNWINNEYSSIGIYGYLSVTGQGYDFGETMHITAKVSVMTGPPFTLLGEFYSDVVTVEQPNLITSIEDAPEDATSEKSTGYFTDNGQVMLPDNENWLSAKLYSTDGRMIQESTVQGTSLYMDNILSNGIYVVHLFGEDNKIAKRWINLQR